MGAGGPSFGTTVALLPKHQTPAVVPTCAPRSPFGDRDIGIAGHVDEEPVPEIRGVVIHVEQRVRAVPVRELGRAHGVAQPPLVGLTSQLQHPTNTATGAPSAASSLTSR